MTNKDFVYFGIDFEATPEERGKALAEFVSMYPAAEELIQKCLLAQPDFQISAHNPEKAHLAVLAEAVAHRFFAEEQREIVRAYAHEMLRGQ